jgi:hypothetical protein
MRSLKINFGGPGNTSIDWNAEVDGLSAVAQRAGVAVMTQVGSDKFIPERGTNVASSLFTYGVFDLLGIQHLLNFGALKARRDMQAYEGENHTTADRVASIRVTLLNIQDRVASVAIRATNQAGQSSREVISIE